MAINYRQGKLNEYVFPLLDATYSRYLILLPLKSLCVMSCSRYCAISVIFSSIFVFQQANICAHASKYQYASYDINALDLQKIKAG